MVPLTDLWLPIVLSAVAVFAASSVIHMFLPYHRSDYAKMPHEDDIRDVLRKANIPPGDYTTPHAGSAAAMSDPAFIDKMTKGPVLITTVIPNGPPSMTGQLVQWFAYCLVVSVFAAYIAGRALGPGADYLGVSQMASATAFAGYALAYWPQTIWYRRKLSTTIKNTFDGVVYGFLTGGMLGWLWPR